MGGASHAPGIAKIYAKISTLKRPLKARVRVMGTGRAGGFGISNTLERKEAMPVRRFRGSLGLGLLVT